MGNVTYLGGGGGTGIKLESIAVKTQPAKTTYTAGEVFDPAGMVVEATYTNGAKATATGYTYSPTTPLPDGTTKVTILYTEGGATKTTEVPITVVHKLAGISIAAQPTKRSYEYQDSFDPTGMVVEASYSDGATANVTGYTCSPMQLSTLGSQTITVRYTERGVTEETTTTVTVERKSIQAVPSQSGSLTYNGAAQSPTWEDYDTEKMTLGGVTSGTNAGSYNATFQPTANYRWSDGGVGTKTVPWSIQKAAGSLSINPTSMSLDTANPSKSITVTRAGNGQVSAQSDNHAAATVSVSGNIVTVTGKGNGSATVTVSVAEGANHTAPTSKVCEVSVSFLKDNFAENSWEAIIAACQSGSVPASWAVGNSKTMTINGADYAIDIIGKNHDDYTSGGKAPLTFQLHDCYGTKHQMNSSDTNTTGWTNCAMRTTNLPGILNAMPAAVKAAIREVNKKTSAGNKSATINTSADKLFLLSEIEIFGSTTYSKAGEGAQYDYYKAGNSKVKKFGGSAYYWWERSPCGDNATHFCAVGSSGGAGINFASDSYGVAFGFCF